MAGRTADSKITKVSRYRAGYIPTHAKGLLDEKDAALEHKKVLSLGALPNREKKENNNKDTRSRKLDKDHSLKREENKYDNEEEEVKIRARSLVTPQVLDIEDDDSLYSFCYYLFIFLFMD